jgi:hypothetical protein
MMDRLKEIDYKGLRMGRRQRLVSCFAKEHTKDVCETCQRRFNLFHKGYNCDWCGRIVCRRHSDWVWGYCFCNQCDGHSIVDEAHSVKLIRSGHMGGHNTVEEFGYLKVGWFSELEDAELRLKLATLKKGANAVLNYYYRTSKRREDNYVYTVFKATGNPARVEPYRK